jgi:hypothetical protein
VTERQVIAIWGRYPIGTTARQRLAREADCAPATANAWYAGTHAIQPRKRLALEAAAERLGYPLPTSYVEGVVALSDTAPLRRNRKKKKIQ